MTPTPENATYAFIGGLVDELVRSGVRHLALCPGSRSTPLAITAARHPRMRVWTLVDERSAGFFALGMARALRAPVAVLSTSGTAAANFLPAVVEARYGRVPLVVLTADRPRELRDSGANQTIDQVRLYGGHAKWFVDAAAPAATEDRLRYVRTLACQAVAMARSDPPGAVHVNIPLGEPLVPVRAPQELPGNGERAARLLQGRDAGRPYAEARRGLRSPDPELIGGLAQDVARGRRGLIVCGPQDDPALPETVGRLARALGYPVLADAFSQVRCGPHDRGCVVDSYDAILRVGDLARALAPDVVLRVGGVPASRPLLTYLQDHAATPQIVIDGGGEWNDPLRVASCFVHADPRAVCDALLDGAQGTRGDPSPPDSEWLGLWQRLGARARSAIRQHVARLDEPFEGRAFSELGDLLPDGSTLYVGNSMPARDLDTFFPAAPRAIRVLGNRGASGIDGLISSALGAAAAEAGPVVLVLGDLAFYHDLNGLLAAKLYRLSATIVLINNDGGGIFSFLPQADYPEHFEALFGTPTGLDFRLAAELYGAAFSRPESWEAFRARVREGLAAGGIAIVEVRMRRDRNVLLHRDAWAAAEAALRAELPQGFPRRTA